MREKAINEGELLKANGFNIYETQGYDWYQWAKLYEEHEELVKQFVQGDSDGPVPFHYPAPNYQDELIGSV